MPAADSRPRPFTLLALFVGAIAVGAVVNGVTLLRAAMTAESALDAAVAPLAQVIAWAAIVSGGVAAVAATGLWRVAWYAHWAVVAWGLSVLGGYVAAVYTRGSLAQEVGRVGLVAVVLLVVFGALARYVWRTPGRP